MGNGVALSQSSFPFRKSLKDTTRSNSSTSLKLNGITECPSPSTSSTPRVNGKTESQETSNLLLQDIHANVADYLKVPGVAVQMQAMLTCLGAERPKDVQRWMREYWSQQLGLGVQSKGEVDWRFFLVSAEKDVLSVSRAALRSSSTQKKKKHAEQLANFIPEAIKIALQTNRITQQDTYRVVSQSPVYSGYEPLIMRFQAAVAFVDASGFTALTERLAKQAEGAEQISSCVNGFFGPLIEILRKHGGDIIKFSGDALTIAWPAERLLDDVTPKNKGRKCQQASFKQRQDATILAARCCLRLQAEVADSRITPVEGVSLTLHVGMGEGKLSVLVVGGLHDRWEYCVAGDPMKQIAIAETLAGAREIVVSPEVCELLQDCPEFSLNVFSDNGSAKGFAKLLGATTPNIAGPEGDLSIPKGVSLLDIDARLVCRFIPKSCWTGVLQGVEEGGDLLCPDEVRRVSLIFLSIRGFDPGTDEGAKRAQLLVRLLQRSVYSLEGSINKFLIDDKGMVLLACFGLPPLYHFADDPVRAVLASMRMCDLLAEEGLDGRVGVTTGDVWCGVIGNDLRREYTVLGDVVNLSARLMGASAPNEVRVDTKTWQRCKYYLEFDELEPIMVKGKEQKVQLYKPTGRQVSSIERHRQRMQRKQSLLSWHEWPAVREVRSLLESFRDQSGVAFVKGRTGSGKTEIVEVVRSWARQGGRTMVSGQNLNPTDTFSVPLLCWEEIFHDLVTNAFADSHWQSKMASCVANGRKSRATVACRASEKAPPLHNLLCAMLESVGAKDDVLAWVPLLNMVLPQLNFSGKVVSAMLERDMQHTKRSRLAQLCATLLDAYVRPLAKGLVVLLHIRYSTAFFQDTDAHNGSICRAVADLCMRRRKENEDNSNIPPLIFIVLSRQRVLEDELLVKYAEECHGMLHLSFLSKSLTRSYTKHCFVSLLGCSADFKVPVSVLEFVEDVTEGNPQGVRSICQELIERGLITESTTDIDRESLDKLPFPEDLVGMACSMFEKLDAAQQGILKHASVLDAPFTVRTLGSALPVNRSPLPLLAECMRFVEAGILIETTHDLPSRPPSSDGMHPGLPGKLGRRPSLDLVTPRSSDGMPGKLARRPSIATFQSPTHIVMTKNFDPECLDRAFRFRGTLFHHVASTLVLRSQRKKILERANRSQGIQQGKSSLLAVPGGVSAPQKPPPFQRFKSVESLEFKF